MVSPLVLLVVGVAILLIFLLPRMYVVWAYLIPALLIPLQQAVLVGPVHIRPLQILTLLVLFQLMRDRSVTGIGRLSLDRAFVLWALSYAIIFTLRWQTSGAVINQLRGLIDSIGVYFALRFLIRSEEDTRRTIRVLAVVACMIGCLMVTERVTGHNPFAILGGVREISEVRNGTVRSQGPFAQAIPAGAFGATLVPLFVGVLVSDPKRRLLPLLAIVAALAIAVTSACSTPVLAIAGALLAFGLWPVRRKMRVLRWGFVALLVGLEFTMKADVWWLISRVDVTGSSTGWDRAALIDNTIRHFSEWWLIGTDNNPNWGFNMWDLCNWFVAQAVQGGLITFIFFVLVIARGFQRLGRARRAAAGDFRKEFFIWAIGAALFSQVCSFFGTSYYDQTTVSWFALLAMIPAVTQFSSLQKADQARSVAVNSDVLDFGAAGAVTGHEVQV
jgi:hypothetical protein